MLQIIKNLDVTDVSEERTAECFAGCVLGLLFDPVRSSKTSVKFYQSSRRYYQEDSTVQSCCIIRIRRTNFIVDVEYQISSKSFG
jgi:hypothetical protein